MIHLLTKHLMGTFRFEGRWIANFTSSKWKHEKNHNGPMFLTMSRRWRSWCTFALIYRSPLFHSGQWQILKNPYIAWVMCLLCTFMKSSANILPSNVPLNTCNTSRKLAFHRVFWCINLLHATIHSACPEYVNWTFQCPSTNWLGLANRATPSWRDLPKPPRAHQSQ